MNLFKNVTAGLLTVAMTGMATAAPTPIHITGSSAYRAAATVAIINQLGGTSCRSIYYIGATTTSGANGSAIFQMFADGTVGSGGTATTIVLTQWTGSLAGVVDLVSQNTLLDFINPTDTNVVSDMNSAAALCTAVTTNSTPQGYTGGKIETSIATMPSAPDASFTDAFQTSVASSVSTCGPIGNGGININGTAVTNGIALAAKVNAASLVEAGNSAPGFGTATGTVGIVPFEWVLGYYYSGTTAPTTSPISNMTQQGALALIESGSVPVGFLNPTSTSGTTDFAYLVGRSEDSATRIDSFAEAQYGFGNPPTQIQYTFSNNQQTTGALPLPTTGVQTGGAGSTLIGGATWPADAPLNTLSKVNWKTTGHGGYVSGGDVKNVLSATNPLTTTTGTVTAGTNLKITGAPSENSGKAYLIGYIGIADAGGVVTTVTHGLALNYNGVPFSPAAVTSGAYTDWGFEHLYYISSGFGAIGSTQKTFVDNIADNIASTYAPSNKTGNVNPSAGDGAGILYDPTSGVGRSAEGAVISYNY